jgi:hypothetical protein
LDWFSASLRFPVKSVGSVPVAEQCHIDWSDALIAGERPNPDEPWVYHKTR